MLLYHKDIGFPESLVINETIFNLGYTNHALKRKHRESGNVLVLPQVVKMTTNNVIEIGTEDNKNISKVVLRIAFDKRQDMVLVLKPYFDKKKATVITFWLNSKQDKHSTLDKTKYNTP